MAAVSTVTAFTQVQLIDEVAGTTQTSIFTNTDSLSQYTLPTNADGTRTYNLVQTLEHLGIVTTYNLAYPTAVNLYSDWFEWRGTLATSGQCQTYSDYHTQYYSSAPAIPTLTSFAVDPNDPKGLNSFFGTAAQPFVSGFNTLAPQFPDELALAGCTVDPAQYLSTIPTTDGPVFTTLTTTSRVVVAPSPTPPSPPGSVSTATVVSLEPGGFGTTIIPAPTGGSSSSSGGIVNPQLPGNSSPNPGSPNGVNAPAPAAKNPPQAQGASNSPAPPQITTINALTILNQPTTVPPAPAPGPAPNNASPGSAAPASTVRVTAAGASGTVVAGQTIVPAPSLATMSGSRVTVGSGSVVFSRSTVPAPAPSVATVSGSRVTIPAPAPSVATVSGSLVTIPAPAPPVATAAGAAGSNAPSGVAGSGGTTLSVSGVAGGVSGTESPAATRYTGAAVRRSEQGVGVVVGGLVGALLGWM